MTDTRTGIGHKTLLRGIIYFDGNPYPVECVVRELSDCAARVELPPGVSVTPGLELQIPVKAFRQPCRTEWHENNEIGVAFGSAASGDDGAGLHERVARLESEITSLKRLLRQLKIEGGTISEVA
jgi:hypothetical protein